MKLFFVFFCCLLLVGCTSHSVHLVHLDGFAGKGVDLSKATYIESRAEQTAFLGFVFDTAYVDQAYQQLLEQCAGSIYAVSSQYSTTHGFLHWTNKLLMKGVCLES